MAVVDVLALLFLAALWGASFLFMRVAAPVLGPVSLIEARVVIAGLGLLVVAAIVRKVPDPRRQLGQFLVLAALSAAVPFTLIAAAELRLTASLAAILNATTPLFALLVSATRERQRPSRRQLLGVLVGLWGVAVLVGLGPLELDGALVLAALASLLAAFCYALGGVYAKVHFSGTHPLATATGQQVGAAILLLGPSLLLPPHESPDAGVVLSVLALAFACTALGFGLFYRLINSVGPTGALTVTFLVPLFGLLWGTVFLDEHLSWSMLVGLALVLSAVFLVTGRVRVPARAASRTAPEEEALSLSEVDSATSSAMGGVAAVREPE